MTPDDIVRQVSIDLNDYAPGHEFTTWPAAQLKAYVIEGMQTAFIYRPDLFIKTKVVKLTPGSAVQKFCDCTQVRRVLGQCNANGRLLYPVRKKKHTDKTMWFGRKCAVNPAQYKLREYSIDDDTDAVWVDPIPPGGQDVYVLIECSEEPTAENVTEVSTELRAAVIQWALFRAKMVDSENSTTISAVAKEHKTTFFQLLKAQVVLKTLVESDSTGLSAQQAQQVNAVTNA